MAHTQPKMLTTAQMCELLNCGPSTLLRLRADEGLPHYRLSTNRIRYPREEVLQWVEARKEGGA